MSNQRGFSPVQILLVIVALAVVGGTGWYVWQSKNKTNNTLANTAKSGTEPTRTEKKTGTTTPAADPTADWIANTNAAGVFSFKHPKGWVSLTCESTTLIGANAASVGHCASEDGGQISISSIEGIHDDQYTLSASEYTGVSKSVLAIDGIQGSVSTGTAKAPNSDQALGGYPEGTKVVQYVFVANNNRTYVMRYVKTTAYQDVLTDFTTLVTKTFKFSI